MLSTTLRRVLVASGIAVTTSFMTAFSASAAPTSSANFTGTVAPSFGIVTDFTSKTTAKTYTTQTSYTPSGGIKMLEATDTIALNSNTDKLNVTAVVTATHPNPPAGTPASSLVGIHSTLVSSNVGSEQITQTDSGTPTAVDFVTDDQGNLTLTVKSTWNPQSGTTTGEELFKGLYTAKVDLTVVAN